MVKCRITVILLNLNSYKSLELFFKNFELSKQFEIFEEFKIFEKEFKISKITVSSLVI